MRVQLAELWAREEQHLLPKNVCFFLSFLFLFLFLNFCNSIVTYYIGRSFFLST